MNILSIRLAEDPDEDYYKVVAAVEGGEYLVVSLRELIRSYNNYSLRSTFGRPRVDYDEMKVLKPYKSDEWYDILDLVEVFLEKNNLYEFDNGDGVIRFSFGEGL